MEPESVSVPAPVLTSAPPVPEIRPVNDVDVASPPAVSVPDPSVIAPAPAIDPTVSDTPAMLKVPAIDIAEVSGTPPDPDNTKVPAEIDVAPVYVFAAPNVREPAPDLDSAAIGVAIGSETTKSPAPTKDNAGVPDVAPIADPVAASKVNVPLVLPIVESAASVTAPAIVFEFATLTSAPLEEIPVPEMEKGSLIVNPDPEMLTAAPEATVVAPAPAPSAALVVIETVPLLTVVAPV